MLKCEIVSLTEQFVVYLVSRKKPLNVSDFFELLVLLGLIIFVEGLTKLIHSRFVDGIQPETGKFASLFSTQRLTMEFLCSPSLIQVDDEDDVVAETRKAMRGWHDDDECEHVINERVKRLNKKQHSVHSEKCRP